MANEGERRVAAEWAFVYCIVRAFLLVDFVNYRIRPVMIAHHVVCLIGHFGALSAPAAFVDYFAAAVACDAARPCAT